MAHGEAFSIEVFSLREARVGEVWMLCDYAVSRSQTNAVAESSLRANRLRHLVASFATSSLGSLLRCSVSRIFAAFIGISAPRWDRYIARLNGSSLPSVPLR